MTHTILFEALFCEQCLNVKLDVLDLANSTGSLAQDLFGFEFLLGRAIQMYAYLHVRVC